MTTIKVTGKIWKSGKVLVIGVNRVHREELRKLRGKQLLIEITPVIPNEKEKTTDG